MNTASPTQPDTTPESPTAKLEAKIDAFTSTVLALAERFVTAVEELAASATQTASLAEDMHSMIADEIARAASPNPAAAPSAPPSPAPAPMAAAAPPSGPVTFNQHGAVVSAPPSALSQNELHRQQNAG